MHVVLNTKVYSETTQKLKIDQHEPPIKMGLILGAPEGKAVPITLFANLVSTERYIPLMQVLQECSYI